VISCGLSVGPHLSQGAGFHQACLMFARSCKLAIIYVHLCRSVRYFTPLCVGHSRETIAGHRYWGAQCTTGLKQVRLRKLHHLSSALIELQAYYYTFIHVRVRALQCLHVMIIKISARRRFHNISAKSILHISRGKGLPGIG